LHQPAHSVIRRSVVDNNDIKHRIAEAFDVSQAAIESLGPVTRADRDGCGGKRWRLRARFGPVFRTRRLFLT
jgi:hypothetical protein